MGSRLSVFDSAGSRDRFAMNDLFVIQNLLWFIHDTISDGSECTPSELVDIWLEELSTADTWLREAVEQHGQAMDDIETAAYIFACEQAAFRVRKLIDSGCLLFER